MLVDGLKVNHLRLVLGTSMGAMHCWVWGEMYPDFVDGLVPLASAPTQIAGRNRVMRKMIMDSITQRSRVEERRLHRAAARRPGRRDQPADDDDQQPAAVAQVRRRRATPPTSGTRIRSSRASPPTDANDMLYQFNASRDYDPSPNLEKITAPLLAINSADDVVNPPELGIMEKLMPRVKHGRYVLIPTSEQTRGHGTHSLPAIWGKHLAEFMR